VVEIDVLRYGEKKDMFVELELGMTDRHDPGESRGNARSLNVTDDFVQGSAR
jgi:hypothetical protein